MSYSIGDVLLLPIPFTDLTSRKGRPAVAVGFSTFVGDLFVVPISSQMETTGLDIQDWSGAGLNVPCAIKSQIATIESALVAKRVGRLRPRRHCATQTALARLVTALIRV